LLDSVSCTTREELNDENLVVVGCRILPKTGEFATKLFLLDSVSCTTREELNDENLVVVGCRILPKTG